MQMKTTIKTTAQSYALLDVEAFKNNITQIRKFYPNSKIILPVKANAYGHGDIIISTEAQKLGIDYLGIARVYEGIKLRENQITLPMIDLGLEYGANIKRAIKYNIELSVSSLLSVKEIEKQTSKLNTKMGIHLKIDTGMRRLGCNIDEAIQIANYIDASNSLKLKSIYTHFAKSDEDLTYSQQQITLFGEIVNKIISNDRDIALHSFNSGAIDNPPHLLSVTNSFVRPGILCYGYHSSGLVNRLAVSPVMTLAAKVILLKKVPQGTGVSYGHIYKTKKETILATIPIGYGDGLFRSLSNNFKVTINGKHYPQIGRISMDLIVVEVDESINIGDEAIIFGNKAKYGCINDADDLSKKLNTISYEITTTIAERVRRIIV